MRAGVHLGEAAVQPWLASGAVRTCQTKVEMSSSWPKYRSLGHLVVSVRPAAPCYGVAMHDMTKVALKSATYITPAVSFDGYDGGRCGDCRWVLWCGPGEPPGMPWHPHP